MAIESELNFLNQRSINKSTLASPLNTTQPDPLHKTLGGSRSVVQKHSNFPSTTTSQSTIADAGRNIMANESICSAFAPTPKVPCTNLRNRSSVHHNILSGEVNPHSYRIRLSPKVICGKMANKQKGITDLYNL